jgi:predicted anti-sigma-YlaC factor YlaD
MTCNDARPLIARFAADDPPADRDALDAHLAECGSCRAALDEQREVALLLRGRLETVPEPGLVARVSARIDQEAGGDGWLGLANWRGWTVGLAPLAAALFAAAYIGVGGPSSNGTVEPGVPTTLEEWTTATAPAALQADGSGEALIEAVLTGVAPSSGESDVR